MTAPFRMNDSMMAIIGLNSRIYRRVYQQNWYRNTGQGQCGALSNAFTRSKIERNNTPTRHQTVHANERMRETIARLYCCRLTVFGAGLMVSAGRSLLQMPSLLKMVKTSPKRHRSRSSGPWTARSVIRIQKRRVRQYVMLTAVVRFASKRSLVEIPRSNNFFDVPLVNNNLIISNEVLMMSWWSPTVRTQFRYWDEQLEKIRWGCGYGRYISTLLISCIHIDQCWAIRATVLSDKAKVFLFYSSMS